MAEISVRAVATGDRQRWEELFHGYRTFYEHPHDEAVAERVWSWLTDAGNESEGIVAALIERLQQIAAAEGASVVRWITADDNATAQRLYDRVATKTHWLTYDASPAVH